MGEKFNQEKVAELSNELVNVLVTSIITKYVDTDEQVNEITDAQKEKIKSIVEGLKTQVDDFVNGEEQKDEVAKEVESKLSPLQEILKRKREKNDK
ncbi:hypothetical protein Q75_07555 [Bacillus coahuilensis p1.1.43]|uniref:Spore coat protein n=1 Tax=Bacillus coahuilensis p1.1.43 TaxID=1150625 RepID=A0A147K858_9BACI|nr:hypothetical protein [Bacillus coahuilensis]KUP06391.1 hypothetical protein Q75_07555 [Bacillus coahuilensis p1.1.43]